jgi:predicted NAD/FAD-binding protein
MADGGSNLQSRRIAVVGSGVAGLGAAWLLSQQHHVTVYEQARYLGGHSNTVEVPGGESSIPVDTGFIVYNPPNYPNLTQLFEHLGVPTAPSDMSFAVSLRDGAHLGLRLLALRGDLRRVTHDV